MGTSSVKHRPKGRNWKKVVSGLSAPTRQSASIVNQTIKIALPVIPIGQSVVPAYYAVSMGIRFGLEVKERGLEGALKREGVRITEEFLIPRISDAMWDIISERLPAGDVNSPVGRLAETAFKKTVSAILLKGAKAMIDEG